MSAKSDFSNPSYEPLASSSHPPSHRKILLAALFVLLLAVLLVVALHAFAWLFWRRRRPPNPPSSRYYFYYFSSPPCRPDCGGLEKDALDSLPVFAYHSGEAPHLECAVCLCEFREKETVRLIPLCGHQFHADCVDTWFRSHASCPLCRVSVQPADHHSSGTHGASTLASIPTPTPTPTPTPIAFFVGGAMEEDPTTTTILPTRASRGHP